jgi:lysozyme family protein
VFSSLFQLKDSQYPKALTENAFVHPDKGSAAWYESIYSQMGFRDESDSFIQRIGERVHNAKNRYLSVSAQTNVPWYLVGAIHSLESDTDFKAVLHNGERIIGTGRKTKLVPRGRGPFSSWESAAVDALEFDDLVKSKDYVWHLGDMLKMAERYNGLGYMKHHPDQNSPYVWACSNQCKLYGKYTNDGSYSMKARTDGQVGVAVIFAYLELKQYIDKIPRLVSQALT